MKLVRFALLLLLIGCSSGEHSKSPFDGVEDKPGILAPGVISTADYHESFNTISEDGLTIYFTRSDKNFETSTLFSSRFTEEGWNKPEVLPFSGNAYDAGLVFSPDGAQAFFTSKRDPGLPGISKAWNIWRVSFNNGQWGKPIPLEGLINSEGQECCLTMNDKGQVFFATDRAGTWDIYQAYYIKGVFNQVKRLSDSLNSADGEWPGYISADGTLLLFSSIRDSGPGGDDIYISRKTGNGWGKPLLLDSLVNTTSFEDNPRLSPDEKFLIYSSWRDTEFSTGVSNIYLQKPNW